MIIHGALTPPLMAGAITAIPNIRVIISTNIVMESIRPTKARRRPLPPVFLEECSPTAPNMMPAKGKRNANNTDSTAHVLTSSSLPYGPAFSDCSAAITTYLRVVVHFFSAISAMHFFLLCARPSGAFYAFVHIVAYIPAHFKTAGKIIRNAHKVHTYAHNTQKPRGKNPRGSGRFFLLFRFRERGRGARLYPP